MVMVKKYKNGECELVDTAVETIIECNICKNLKRKKSTYIYNELFGIFQCIHCGDWFKRFQEPDDDDLY